LSKSRVSGDNAGRVPPRTYHSGAFGYRARTFGYLAGTAIVRNENITILGPKALLEEIRLIYPRVGGFALG
jgi:hypothetical protein